MPIIPRRKTSSSAYTEGGIARTTIGNMVFRRDLFSITRLLFTLWLSLQSARPTDAALWGDVFGGLSLLQEVLFEQFLTELDFIAASRFNAVPPPVVRIPAKFYQSGRLLFGRLISVRHPSGVW